MMDLQAIYPRMHEALVDLFGPAKVHASDPRLNEIFEECERAWMSNLKEFKPREVKYILIGEAPPWTASDPHSYFYSNLKGNWASRILSAFQLRRRGGDFQQLLQALRACGFLLVDSLPFSMNYKGTRNNMAYPALVAACADYLQGRLELAQETISPEIRIALAFKINGRCIIETFPRGLPINGVRHSLCENHISADGSGFSNPGKLRVIWGLI